MNQPEQARFQFSASDSTAVGQKPTLTSLFRIRFSELPDEVPCPDCNGAGKSTYRLVDACLACHGEKVFRFPDLDALFAAVTTTRGKVRRFRASKPDVNEYRSIHEARVYFVWRLTRFHGGADVCIPVMATTTTVTRDPYRKVYDVLVDVLARAVFGTDRAGAARWAPLLGLSSGPVPAGLPASAYPGGPVADENKPESELLELLG